MKNSMNSRKNAARMERQKQRLEAGTVSTHFPEVESIAVSMTYSQRGILKTLPRTVNFFPGSSAFFRVACLSKDCVEGGFDLTQVITAMIGSRKMVSKGDISCEGNGPSSDHSTIGYEVAIKYTQVLPYPGNADENLLAVFDGKNQVSTFEMTKTDKKKAP